MLELALFDRETLKQRFNCSQRLASRIGAWLGQKIALTVTVLESAAAGSDLEKLLLRRTLLTSAAALPAQLEELLNTPEFTAVAEEFSPTVTSQDGWTVIATAEDALASAGFANLPTAEPATAAATPALAPSIVRPAELSRPAGAPATDAAAFSPEETARLRINIFTAPTSAEKVSALGQFAYAPVPPAEQIKVFMQALADEDAKLRSAAARGIRQFGVDADIAETLAAFAVRSETALNAERLEDLLTDDAAPAARGAVMMLLAGCVRDAEFTGDDLAAALRALARIIRPADAALAAQPDFLRQLQERMLSEGTLRNFREVFAAVEKTAPGRVSAHFFAEILQTRSDAYRALLFALIDGWTVDAAPREKLLPLAVSTFAALPVDHPQGYALRKFIFDSGEAGLDALMEALPALSTAHQRTSVRFTDNFLRSHDADSPAHASVTARAARSFLALLERAPLALRVDILETQVCLRAGLPPELGAAVAQAVLRDWTDYAAWPLNTTFENALVRLGLPAVTPLLKQLRAQKNHPASAVFASALGRIGIALPADAPDADRSAADILREIATMTFRETAIRDALHIAMGRIAARPGIPAGINSMVRRTLMERLGRNPESAPLILALGHACGGNLDNPEETRFLLTFATQHLEREAAEPEMAKISRDGEEMFEVGSEVGVYSEVIPACIEALQHLASGAQVPWEIRDATIRRLLDFAEEPQKLAVCWGLANASLLTTALGHIGAAPVTNDRERLAIAVILSHRINSTAALDALAGLVAIPNRLPQFDRLATALVTRLSQKILHEKNDEERGIYLRILTKALMRGRFAVRQGTVEEMLEPVADLYLSSLKQGLPGTWQLLDSLRGAGVFSGATAELVGRELDAFTTLRKTGE